MPSKAATLLLAATVLAATVLAATVLAVTVLAGATQAIAQSHPSAGGKAVLGSAPTYSDRALGKSPAGPLPNEAAIERRIWVPGLDDGYVPQGLTVVDGAIYVGSYRSIDTAVGRGPCRLYRIDPESGKTTGELDLPATCGHAGGLARGAAGRLWVADTRVVFEIALAERGSPTIGTVLREVPLTGKVKGAFAAGTADALWLGSYERDGPGRIWRIPHEKIGATIGDDAATLSFEVPSRAQGAAFDAKGALWITRSGATLGEVMRLDPTTGTREARHALPDGVEDLSFDAAGRIWTLSEAGSRRWLGWATFFPVLFRLDPARLR